jgi:hypothetical protein
MEAYLLKRGDYTGYCRPGFAGRICYEPDVCCVVWEGFIPERFFAAVGEYDSSLSNPGGDAMRSQHDAIRSFRPVLTGILLSLLSLTANNRLQADLMVDVPATASIYLAGQPNGTVLGFDSASTNSPVFIDLTSFRGNGVLTFSATGATSRTSDLTNYPLVGQPAEEPTQSHQATIHGRYSLTSGAPQMIATIGEISNRYALNSKWLAVGREKPTGKLP